VIYNTVGIRNQFVCKLRNYVSEPNVVLLIPDKGVVQSELLGYIFYGVS